MGGGGYVAGPVGLAALTLRIPLVLTEADSHLGLTNRVLARAARRVCLAFPLAGREGRATASPAGRCLRRRRIASARGRASGSPPGSSACSCSAARWERARSTWRRSRRSRARRYGRSIHGGGVNGRCVIGEMSTDAAVRVLHVAGRRDYPELAARRSALPERYDLREYLDLDEFADALAAADLVVARAGGSVFEIAASGMPAILVPYPHASADHQTANARWMADAGAAVVIPDGELTRGAPGAGGRGAAGRQGAPGGDGLAPRATWPGRTLPRISPTSCWRPPRMRLHATAR